MNTNGLDNAWTYPSGLSTPAATVAVQARRYMHEYGATSRDFGAVAVACRRHAATNPDAWFYGKPITIEDHQASRMIADPLHLLDCCQESDGAVAVVVTSTERAQDLRKGAVPILAAAQGSAADQFVMTSFYREDIGIPEMGVVGRELWRQSGLRPADMDTAVLYDHFTPYVLMQLEELGFCGRGEAAGFVADGAIELGGRLPLNTHGGQLGEAYIHGMNGINEAVRQLRGDSVNQVEGAAHVLVTAGTGVPTSGLVLGRDGRGRGAPLADPPGVSRRKGGAVRADRAQYADGLRAHQRAAARRPRRGHVRPRPGADHWRLRPGAAAAQGGGDRPRRSSCWCCRRVGLRPGRAASGSTRSPRWA